MFLEANRPIRLAPPPPPSASVLQGRCLNARCRHRRWTNRKLSVDGDVNERSSRELTRRVGCPRRHGCFCSHRGLAWVLSYPLRKAAGWRVNVILPNPVVAGGGDGCGMGRRTVRHRSHLDPYLTVVPFWKEKTKVKVICIPLCLQDLAVRSTRGSRLMHTPSIRP